MNSKIDMPPFSVLMSVYINDDDVFFEQALASILTDQTLMPNQLVLVVDGPIRDQKNAIIQRYQASFPETLDVLKLPENLGQGPALNKGLQQCRYEYVARMDADDISLPDRFQKQVGFMLLHPEVDLSSGFVEEFNQIDKSHIRRLPLETPSILKYSKMRSPINHGACIYKKSKVQSCGGYNTFYQVQDYALFVAMIRAGAILRNQSDILVRVRLYDEYARKSGLKYFLEEVMLAWQFFKIGHLGFGGLIRNLSCRAAPRLLGSRAVGILYRKILR